MSRPGTAAARLTARARPGIKTSSVRRVHDQGPGELASLPAGPRPRAGCLRYDQHAVYLGQPVANQQCPRAPGSSTPATISLQGGRLRLIKRQRRRRVLAQAIPWTSARRSGPSPRSAGSVTRDAQDQQLSTLAARGSGGLGHRDLHRGAAAGCCPSSAACCWRAPARAGQLRRRAAATVRPMTRSAAVLATGTGQHRAGPARRGDPAHRLGRRRRCDPAHHAPRPAPAPPGPHRARRHRHARKHPGSRHNGQPAQGPLSNQGRKHGASHHRAGKHKSISTRPASTRARKHRARKHRARKHPPTAITLASTSGPGTAPIPRNPRLRQGLRGFDSCTTPSLSAMRAWRRTVLSATAVYIGGVEAGCASPQPQRRGLGSGP